MIEQLCIQDFIIIEKLNVNFTDGLTVITGETGAGKSIILSALNLLLGGRVDSSMIRPGCTQAHLSVHFKITDLAKNWLKQHGFDSQQCIIRRVIGKKGRSRAYINDQLSNLSNLAALGECLLDIHSQHAHQGLLKMEQQRLLIDSMIQPNKLYQKVVKRWQDWHQLELQWRKLGGNKSDRENRMILLRYQIDELDQVLADCGDLDVLETQHQRLAHAGQLQAQGQQVLSYLQDEINTQGILNLLHQSIRELSAMQTHDKTISESLNLVEQAAINADEAWSELNRYTSQLVIDPEQFDILETQLRQLQDLSRKHQCKSMDLPDLLKQLKHQLDNLIEAEHLALTIDDDRQVCLLAYNQAAKTLSKQRQNSANTLAKAISSRIKTLGMAQGQFEIEVNFQSQRKPSQYGADELSFLVSTNLKQPLRPLNKVASGGELSRISLAIQVILSQDNGVDSLIFDEVDVGIGGAIAEIIGQQLSDLSQQRQVICITHLAQVAAYGNHHFLVEKILKKQQTISQLRCLDPNQRIEELARMSGGIERTEESMAHARSLLTDSRAYQQGVFSATA